LYERGKSMKELFCMSGIPGSDTFVKIEPINKGFSRDKKYYIETADGRRMLLRVTDISEFDRKKAENKMMERAYASGVLTPQLLNFGLCNDGQACYSLLDWFDGEDVEEALPRLSESEQYFIMLPCNENRSPALRSSYQQTIIYIIFLLREQNSNFTSQS